MSPNAFPINYHEMIVNNIIQAASLTLTCFFLMPALAWFGMWSGMTSKKTSIAVLKTLGFVFFVPMVGGFFCDVFLRASVINGNYYNFVIIKCLIKVAIDIAFIVWVRQRLYGHFREILERGTANASQKKRKLISPIPANIPVSETSD